MVILARALLQLFCTPWLGPGWNKNSIAFLNMADSDNTPDVLKPYLITRFDTTTVNDKPFEGLHPIPDILALGILLIEIESGKPIESARTPDSLVDGQITINTDYYTSWKMYEVLRQEGLNDKMQTIIEQCLKPGLASLAIISHHNSYDDNMIRELLYETLILPLEDQLRSLQGHNAPPADIEELLSSSASWLLEDCPSFGPRDYVQPDSSNICHRSQSTLMTEQAPHSSSASELRFSPCANSFGRFALFDDYQIDPSHDE